MSAEEIVEAETPKVLAIFFGVRLLVSILFATYGLDLSPRFFQSVLVGMNERVVGQITLDRLDVCYSTVAADFAQLRAPPGRDISSPTA